MPKKSQGKVLCQRKSGKTLFIKDIVENFLPGNVKKQGKLFFGQEKAGKTVLSGKVRENFYAKESQGKLFVKN